MTISHLYLTPHDEFNGIVMHQQMKELINQGHEVQVISPVAWTPFPISQMSKKWQADNIIPKCKKQKE